MTRILLIDDDPALRDILSLALEDAGFDVVVAEDGHAGLAAMATADPAVVVSDVNMPRLDGFSLCRRLREGGSTVPVILLTSRDSEIDEALGLELGADDYVTKPFSTRILLARIGALVRREQHRSQADQVSSAIEIGHLSLDAERLEVRYRNTPVTVTVTEFRMIEALSRRPGVVLSRGRLLEQMRGDDSVVAERLVDTYIRRMRRKFEQIDTAFAEIETVVGAGYRWRG
ncbi:MAG: response regulator transcription factor [Myxococcota bacterium]|nr:response regulator transcription factor [Myxococcota bacterium]